MKILVINPNTCETMTNKIGERARKVASPGTEIFVTNPTDGCPSVEGFYDMQIATIGILQVIKKNPNMDAYVMAGSHDMALDAARMLTTAPVIGIGEAAFHFASILSCKFVVITTLPRIAPVVEQNLTKYGLIARCAKVRALGIPVLSLETNSKVAERQKFDLVSSEIDKAIKENGAEAVTLGCGGFADMADELSKKHGIPVIEGVGCAVKLAESFVSLGMKNSKIGGYATPNPKVFSGIFKELSPGDK